MQERAATDVRVFFREGWVKAIGVALGGTGSVAVVLGTYELIEREPKLAFDLLAQWGGRFVLCLVFGVLLYKLAILFIAHLARLAAGVQEMAVAMARLADKDDRERDRMITETMYVGAQMQKVSATIGEVKEQMNRIEQHVMQRTG